MNVRGVSDDIKDLILISLAVIFCLHENMSYFLELQMHSGKGRRVHYTILFLLYV